MTDQRVAARLLALDAAAPAAEVADDVAQELLGGDDLDREDRLEQDRLGALGRLLEARASPATLKAISEESVSWYLPSISVTRTSTIG